MYPLSSPLRMRTRSPTPMRRSRRSRADCLVLFGSNRFAGVGSVIAWELCDCLGALSRTGKSRNFARSDGEGIWRGDLAISILHVLDPPKLGLAISGRPPPPKARTPNPKTPNAGNSEKPGLPPSKKTTVNTASNWCNSVIANSLRKFGASGELIELYLGKPWQAGRSCGIPAPGRNAFYIYAPGSKGVPRARAGCADPGLRRPPQECPGPAQGVQIQAPREEGRESRSDPRRTSLRRAL